MKKSLLYKSKNNLDLFTLKLFKKITLLEKNSHTYSN